MTASTRATAPATSAMRSERPREGLGPALVAKVSDTTGNPGCAGSSGEGEGAGVGVGARPPFQVSAATSCSASSRTGSTPPIRASASTASRGGSDLPPRYRSHDFWLYPVFAASWSMFSSL